MTDGSMFMKHLQNLQSHIDGVKRPEPTEFDSSKDVFIYDDCEHDLECITESNNGWCDAWSEFEKANPDKVCTECMNCSMWVALKKITEDYSCPRCGGDLYNEED